MLTVNAWEHCMLIGIDWEAQLGCGKTDRFRFVLALCVSIIYLQDGVLQIGMVNARARCELFAGGSCALGLSSIAAD
jgi:hypothetical protein